MKPNLLGFKMSKHSFGHVSDVIEVMERVERMTMKGEDKKAAVLSILRNTYPIR